jgi:ectoine hydroxylase-related dioxygenase (phytanoyl-CoA dioxygenase family)
MSENQLMRLTNDATVDDVLATIVRDGGLIIEDFLSADVLEGLRTDLYPRLAATAAGMEDGFAGVRTRRLSRLFAHSRWMADIALHPLYIGAAEALIEKPIQMWVGDERVSVTPGLRVGATQAIQIGPGQKAQPLHRDDLAFMWQHPLYGREARCQIMVAISDFTADNGGTLVIPGSHRWDDERKPERHEAIPTLMKAGSALMFVGSLYHAGGENSSTDTRTGLSMTLDAANLRQEENMYLSLSSEVVRSYPEPIQRLLGWSSGKNYMGWVEVDGQMVDPISLLQDGPPSDRAEAGIRLV